MLNLYCSLNDPKRDHSANTAPCQRVFRRAGEGTLPHPSGNIWVNDGWAADNTTEPEWSDRAGNLRYSALCVPRAHEVRDVYKHTNTPYPHTHSARKQSIPPPNNQPPIVMIRIRNAFTLFGPSHIILFNFSQEQNVKPQPEISTVTNGQRWKVYLQYTNTM